jgi:hypothetical protein
MRVGDMAPKMESPGKKNKKQFFFISEVQTDNSEDVTQATIKESK